LNGKFVSDIFFHSINIVWGTVKINQYKVFSRFSENKIEVETVFPLMEESGSNFSALRCRVSNLMLRMSCDFLFTPLLFQDAKWTQALKECRARSTDIGF
jgi:hypothetical protein